MSPIKPLVEVTGPVNVVLAIFSTFLHKDLLCSLCNVRWASKPVYKADMMPFQKIYITSKQKERGDPKTASIKPNREEKLGN